MPASLQELGLDQWSVADRRWLIEELQASVDVEEEEIPQWHKDVLNVRLDRYDAGEQELLTWDEVMLRVGDK